jgi:nicotinate-nucleotide pyrophosphorylase (carboxylating)
VLSARRNVHHLQGIEVEVKDLQEVRQALGAGADAIMLDNMLYEEIADAVAVIRASGRHVTIEVSGNLTADRLPRLAGLGVDLVSMGGLIHQATWADLSMRWGAEDPPI